MTRAYQRLRQARHEPNRRAREVRSGHYVLVSPTPLLEPYLVVCVPHVMRVLGIDESECNTEAFVRLFSGEARRRENERPHKHH